MAVSAESDSPSFVIQTDEDRAAFVERGLAAYNRPFASPLWKDSRFHREPLHVYCLDHADQVIGGLIGRTHAIPEWLEIVALWVVEDRRGQGIGSRLMRHAEAEAVRRGCRFARLATGDYQAPRFYEKLGYRLYGTLENCPQGETVFYYCKELDRA